MTYLHMARSLFSARLASFKLVGRHRVYLLHLSQVVTIAEHYAGESFASLSPRKHASRYRPTLFGFRPD